MARNTDHLQEAKVMLYDNPQVAIGHALIAMNEELACIRMWVADIAERTNG